MQFDRDGALLSRLSEDCFSEKGSAQQPESDECLSLFAAVSSCLEEVDVLITSIHYAGRIDFPWHCFTAVIYYVADDAACSSADLQLYLTQGDAATPPMATFAECQTAATSVGGVLMTAAAAVGLSARAASAGIVQYALRTSIPDLSHTSANLSAAPAFQKDAFESAAEMARASRVSCSIDPPPNAAAGPRCLPLVLSDSPLSLLRSRRRLYESLISLESTGVPVNPSNDDGAGAKTAAVEVFSRSMALADVAMTPSACLCIWSTQQSQSFHKEQRVG